MRERATLETERVLLRALAPTEKDVPRSYEGKEGEVEKDPDSLKIPLRWICRLRLRGMIPRENETTKRDNLGTGVLIGPRHVLTAAHLLEPFYTASANQITSIDVMPAYGNGTDRLGTYSMKNPKNLRVAASWRDASKREADPLALPQDKSAGNDFGMIILNDDKISTDKHKSLDGRALGYWGHPTRGNGTVFSPLPAKFLIEPSKPMHTAGYPTNEGKVWSGSGSIFNLLGPKDAPRPAFNHLILKSLGEKAKGISGGPLWIKVNNTRFLTGLNSSVISSRVETIDKQNKKTVSTEWRGSAARLSIGTFEEIVRWMHADP